MHSEVLVVGGGLGGIAAAYAALQAGRSVVLSEEYDWLGGQLTSHAVPPACSRNSPGATSLKNDEPARR
jgi:NADPH-dependent 2,4-dienoyl-CoA reductase/sulfur reductase-like enzyme